MRRPKADLIILGLLALAFIGYWLPWVITPEHSLSLGAYDLAEWSSLHPLVRQTAPFLWTTLALRLPLGIIGILFAAYLNKTFQHPLITVIMLGIAAIAMLPPLEFFTTYRDDPNYRQQFILAVLIFIIGVVPLVRRFGRVQTGLRIVLSILGALSSAFGLYQAYSLLHDFQLPVSLGLGGILTIIALVILAYRYITKQSSQATLFEIQSSLKQSA